MAMLETEINIEKTIVESWRESKFALSILSAAREPYRL
jgi:hypothetical protein